MKLSHLSDTLIGSEIVKLGGEIRERIRNGENIYNFTVGDFDPNIFPVATGMEEHRQNAISYFEATKWIKENLPHAKISGGVSNVSFSFRGNDHVREAIHAAFLYHAIQAGMDMGIVNPGMLQVYDEIEKELLELVEDVLFDRRDDSTERLINHAEIAKNILGFKNVKFMHGNFTQLDFRNYDHFYFYNSFYENLDGTNKIDNSNCNND